MPIYEVFDKVGDASRFIEAESHDDAAIHVARRHHWEGRVRVVDARCGETEFFVLYEDAVGEMHIIPRDAGGIGAVQWK